MNYALAVLQMVEVKGPTAIMLIFIESMDIETRETVLWRLGISFLAKILVPQIISL